MIFKIVVPEPRVHIRKSGKRSQNIQKSGMGAFDHWCEGLTCQSKKADLGQLLFEEILKLQYSHAFNKRKTMTMTTKYARAG